MLSVDEKAKKPISAADATRKTPAGISNLELGTGGYLQPVDNGKEKSFRKLIEIKGKLGVKMQVP